MVFTFNVCENWKAKMKEKCERRRYSWIEYSRNTQKWQHWHYCTTSNGNKLEITESWISFNAKWHFPPCSEFILKWLTALSYLLWIISIIKMATLCTIRKLEWTLTVVGERDCYPPGAVSTVRGRCRWRCAGWMPRTPPSPRPPARHAVRSTPWRCHSPPHPPPPPA